MTRAAEEVWLYSIVSSAAEALTYGLVDIHVSLNYGYRSGLEGWRQVNLDW
jgi:hypothetical protein